MGCALVAVTVAGCSESSNKSGKSGQTAQTSQTSQSSQSSQSSVDSSTAASSTSGKNGKPETILIKTEFADFDGTVLNGSVLGDSPFCVGGTLHHEAGSPEIGHPAINVFTCGNSQLKIGFGPGPDQMDNKIQTSDWDVLQGTGQFSGMTGSGQMKVEFPKAGASTGKETFTGTVTVP